MKLIELSQNRVAIVDDEDFEWLSKWKWCYRRGKKRKTGYALCTEGYQQNQQQQTILMHVAVLKRHRRWKHATEVDHINTCGCDNRKINLRIGTPITQGSNKRKYSNNKSGITGVHWHKQKELWHAYIRVAKRLKHLGYFTNKKDAITARRQAEIKYFGEYRFDPKKLCPLWKTGQCPDCAKRAEELGII